MVCFGGAAATLGCACGKTDDGGPLTGVAASLGRTGGIPEDGEPLTGVAPGLCLLPNEIEVLLRRLGAGIWIAVCILDVVERLF